jgi:flagellar hook assembly protein FlgD
MGKRLLSIFMAMTMLITTATFTGFADGADGEVTIKVAYNIDTINTSKSERAELAFIGDANPYEYVIYVTDGGTNESDALYYLTDKEYQTTNRDVVHEIFDGYNTDTGKFLEPGMYTVAIKNRENSLSPVFYSSIDIEVVNDSSTSGGNNNGGSNSGGTDNGGQTTEETIINNVELSETTVNPGLGDGTEITIEAENGFIRARVIDANGRVVKTFDDFDGTSYYEKNDSPHRFFYDGEDDDNNDLEAGRYILEVSAKANSRSSYQTAVTKTFSVTEYNSRGNGVIKDVKLNVKNRGTHDPVFEDLEIEIDFWDDVDRVTIFAERYAKGNIPAQVVEIDRFRNVEENELIVYFDTMDDDGDILRDGDWNIVVQADGDVVVVPLEIGLDEPEIIEAFVTKEEVDFDLNEKSYLVFKASRTGLATARVYDGTRKEATIFIEKSVRKNLWYYVEIDGEDREGDQLLDGDYSIEIEIENEYDNDVMDRETVSITIENDDERSSRRNREANAFADMIYPPVFEENTNEDIILSAELEDDEDEVEVLWEIFEGENASGREVITISDYETFDTGLIELSWDGRDENGRRLSDGIYSYKLTVRSDRGRRDTETGKFAVGDNEDEYYNRDRDRDDDDDVYHNDPTYRLCGGYVDTFGLDRRDEELCDAIEFASNKGIFQGREGNTFAVNDGIKRAEAAAVIFRTFRDAELINGLNISQLFTDVKPNRWYTTFVQSSYFYGITTGYSNNLYKPSRYVSRGEMVKMILEASAKFEGLRIESADVAFSDINRASERWVADYASYVAENDLMDTNNSFRPHSSMTRGDVAIMLYRMNDMGLISL